MASFHAAFAGTLLLPLCLLLRQILKFRSVGAPLMRFTWTNVTERGILVSNFSVMCNSLREFHTLDWFQHVCALPENRLRRRHVLKYTTQLSCTWLISVHGSRNFRKLLSVSWEFDCVHCDYFEIQLLHQGLCELLVIKSPKFFCSRYCFTSAFTAKGPCNLVSLAYFAISVLRKWVKILWLCFLDTTFGGRSASESWEVLAGLSLNVNTCSSSKFLCELWQIFQQITLFQYGGPYFFFVFWFSVGSRNGFPVLECLYFDLVSLLDLTKSLVFSSVLRWRCRRGTCSGPGRTGR